MYIIYTSITQPKKLPVVVYKLYRTHTKNGHKYNYSSNESPNVCIIIVRLYVNIYKF